MVAGGIRLRDTAAAALIRTSALQQSTAQMGPLEHSAAHRHAIGTMGRSRVQRYCVGVPLVDSTLPRIRRIQAFRRDFFRSQLERPLDTALDDPGVLSDTERAGSLPVVVTQAQRVLDVFRQADRTR